MGKHSKPYDDHHETDVLAEIVEETPDLNALKTSQYQPLYDPHGTSPLPQHHEEPEPPPTGEYVGPSKRMSPTIVSGIALVVIVVAIVLAIVIISTNGAPLCR